MPRIWSLLTLLLTMLLIFLSIRSTSPPTLRQGEMPDSVFSVKNAYSFLVQIARAPHSTGTLENDRVRQYIAHAASKLGFAVEIQNTTSVNTRGGYVNAASINNIIAVKKGLHNSKAVMLMAHYDTQPNSPGAADDGAGVAAMLETARALQHVKALENDLILLFTDGEEVGLMGARAFVNESPLMKNIGLVINFEGRGNSGPSNMFELNENNGWAIEQYAKAAAHPFGNSLGYEIYKKMPNTTDFTVFKNSGVSGWNNAYINGFVNYHSPNDKPENMDLRSLQHQGDNMLSLVKHFGGLQIKNTRAPDASYFNAAGGWFVHYPASFNLAFVLTANIFFIWLLVAGFAKNDIKLGSFIVSALLFPAVLATIYFSSKYLLRIILARYPLYTHFDQNNSYNSGWYFLAFSAWALTICSFIYYLAIKKISTGTLLAGIVATAVLLMNAMQYYMPSASYLLFIPLLFILGARLLIFYKKANEALPSGRLTLVNLAGVLPVICLLAPIVYFTFIVFSLGTFLPFVVVAAGICAGLLLPVILPVLKTQKLLVPIVSILCFFGFVLAGHFTSAYTQKSPLQSYRAYSWDADSAKGKWSSEWYATDKWTADFLKSQSADKRARHANMQLNSLPGLAFLPTSAAVKKDTLENGRRKLAIRFNSSSANGTNINFAIADSSNVSMVLINGKEARAIKNINTSWVSNINYTGCPGNGVDIVFSLPAVKKLYLTVTERSIGLPPMPDVYSSYPKNVIPSHAANSNTTSVKKRFVF